MILKSHFGEYPVIKSIGDANILTSPTSYLKGVDNADKLCDKIVWRPQKSALPEYYLGISLKKNIRGFITVQPTISDDLKEAL